jgi:hypothetical protein
VLESSAALGAWSRGRGLSSPREAGHRVEPRGRKGVGTRHPVEEGAFPIRTGGPVLVAKAEPATAAAPPGNPPVLRRPRCSLQVFDGLAPSPQIEDGEQNDQNKDAPDHEGRSIVVRLLTCVGVARTTRGRRR